MNDGAILELFIFRDERAIEATEKKYGPLCRAIALNVLGDPEDAEECLSDALLILWNNVPKERPRSLKAYLIGVTKKRALLMLRSMSTEKRGGGISSESLDELAECIPSNENVEERVETRALTGLINDWLRSLGDEDRALFIRRYWFEDTVAELAAKSRKPYKRIAHRLSALRKKLKNHLEREGFLI